jgi:hypothetical protein
VDARGSGADVQLSADLRVGAAGAEQALICPELSGQRIYG